MKFFSRFEMNRKLIKTTWPNLFTIKLQFFRDTKVPNLIHYFNGNDKFRSKNITTLAVVKGFQNNIENYDFL